MKRIIMILNHPVVAPASTPFAFLLPFEYHVEFTRLFPSQRGLDRRVGFPKYIEQAFSLLSAIDAAIYVSRLSSTLSAINDGLAIMRWHHDNEQHNSPGLRCSDRIRTYLASTDLQPFGCLDAPALATTSLRQALLQYLQELSTSRQRRILSHHLWRLPIYTWSQLLQRLQEGIYYGCAGPGLSADGDLGFLSMSTLCRDARAIASFAHTNPTIISATEDLRQDPCLACQAQGLWDHCRQIDGDIICSHCQVANMCCSYVTQVETYLVAVGLGLSMAVAGALLASESDQTVMASTVDSDLILARAAEIEQLLRYNDHRGSDAWSWTPAAAFGSFPIILGDLFSKVPGVEPPSVNEQINALRHIRYYTHDAIYFERDKDGKYGIEDY